MMNNRNVEKRIQSAYRDIAPDILDSVLSDCTEQKGATIVMMEQKKTYPALKRLAALAAAFAVVLLGAFGIYSYREEHTVASRITLDVNPGIEIHVNKAEKVLAVNPMNKDAETVIGTMDFTGSSLEVTVNALIGSMLRNGYLSEAANSILVTVDHSDSAQGLALQTKLMTEINEILANHHISGAVLGQTVNDTEELRQLSDRYGITEGKARLIHQIVTQNTLYSFEQLVPLTINELNLISETGSMKLDNIQSIGTASASAYISEDEAKAAALAHAGISEAEALRLRCGLDWEDGRMIYEVEFEAAGWECSYEIDAKTGAILQHEKEADDDGASAPSPVPEQNSSFIGASAAKKAAYAHAGVSASAVRNCVCALDREHGIHVYDIEFEANGWEYEYEINALDGSIVKYSKEQEDEKPTPTQPALSQPSPTRPTPTQPTPSKPAQEGSLIGASAAKAAALTHAGVSAAAAKDLECELERENGKAFYEISFEVGASEYEYVIDAVNGNVLRYHKETDEDDEEPQKPTPTQPAPTQPAPTQPAPPSEPALIGTAAAKAAALAHAGVSAAEVKDLECELEKENGKVSYEVSFETDDYEYEYVIDAQTGAVIRFTREADD